MRKDLTEIVFILDRSGSMSGLEADTIGGYNSMLGKQKKETGEAVISTILFDDRTEILHDREALPQIEPITDKEYYVRGCTALLDAVGGAIHHIGKLQKELPEEEKPEKTLFIITTDGMENASKRYSYEKVKRMVEKKKRKNHWEFIFLGANIDAVQVAGRFGVAANRAVRFENDSMGAELNFEVMSSMVSCARKASSAQCMEALLDSDDSLAVIREDYEDLRSFSGSKERQEDVTDKERAMIEAVFPELKEREQEMARKLFGIDGEKVHTYEEAGRIFSLSAERMHQSAARIKRIAHQKAKREII